MAKRIFKRFVPDHRTLREHKHLQWFGKWLHDPNIWHFNRRSVAGAFSVGLFAAFIPMPFQMILAASLAIPCRVNLPISVGLVWLTNPVTMPPVFYVAYKIGAWIMGLPALQMSAHMTWDQITQDLGSVWQPFLLGSLVLAVTGALVGNLGVRLFWRLHLLQYIKRRRQRRCGKHPTP
jgi:uncharacterized protein (DUF2062 family)